LNKSLEKGQIAALDAFVAITLFMLLYLSLDSIWNDKLLNIQQLEMQNNMQFKAIQAISVMLDTQGIPFNWEKSPADTNAIGLVGKNKEIQKDKLTAFASLDYNTAQFLLKTAPYNFRFEFDATGNNDDVNIGRNIDANNTVVAIERATKFNGGIAIARIKIFR
jgi:hypothetical protein